MVGVGHRFYMHLLLCPNNNFKLKDLIILIPSSLVVKYIKSMAVRFLMKESINTKAMSLTGMIGRAPFWGQWNPNHVYLFSIHMCMFYFEYLMPLINSSYTPNVVGKVIEIIIQTEK